MTVAKRLDLWLRLLKQLAHLAPETFANARSPAHFQRGSRRMPQLLALRQSSFRTTQRTSLAHWTMSFLLTLTTSQSYCSPTYQSTQRNSANCQNPRHSATACFPTHEAMRLRHEWGTHILSFTSCVAFPLMPR